jgi:diguanylate cyclase (GGDEF)-like protein/PAS domain S-box-containing protein
MKSTSPNRRDISHKAHDNSLSKRLENILKHSWNEIYTFEMSSLAFVDASDGACQNLGYSLDELRKLTPLNLKPEFTQADFEKMIGPLKRGESTQLNFETIHQRKDGSQYPVDIRLSASFEETPPVFIAFVQDITERKQYIAELEQKMMYDTLTGLPNRSLLEDRLLHTLKQCARNKTTLAVLIVDVMRLRDINDILGHINGDAVLREVARRLQGGLRESDTIARLGGDEFALVLPDVDIKYIAATADKINKLFEQPIVIEETSLEIEIAIGIALYPDHGDEGAMLFRHADIAMRVAKTESRAFSLYHPEEDPFSLRRLRHYGELRQAISDKTLTLYFQPKINIAHNHVLSVEALARWPHPVDGMICPGEFIPMIEQTGMIRPFTHWVLEQAIRQCKEWANAGIDLVVAVNLSTRNLLDPEMPAMITQLLATYQVNADRLILEITESAVMSRPEIALKVLQRLQATGLKLSIDDFGTGYSSLAYLKKLPVYELKIDHSFIIGLCTNDNDEIIVRSTIDLAHNLGLHAVAEGVENQDILDMLGTLGCDTAQGFHIGHPMPAQELEAWLKSSPWEYTKR